jgi:hypothetical protein
MTRRKDELYSPNGWKRAIAARIAERVIARNQALSRVVHESENRLKHSVDENPKQEQKLGGFPPQNESNE